MHVIDRYAYSTRIRRVNPMQKAALSLLVIVLCLVLDRPAVGLLGVLWMWLLASYWSQIPSSLFGRLLLAEGLFLILAVSAVAINVGTIQDNTGWNWSLGPLWVGTNLNSIDAALRLLTRSLAGASAMNFLALTTPMVDLVDTLRRLRMPILLVDLMTLVYRFIFALSESASRMYVAQDSRLGYVTLRRGISSAGVLATQLFVDAYQRSSRLQNALESRGYDAELKVLPLQYRRDPALFCFGVAIAGSLFLVWMLT